MNITMIHGQSHKGTSYHMGELFIRNLTGEVKVNEFFLPHDMPEFCCGCYQCIEGSMANCPHYGKVRMISKAMEEAELLIFTTPVYCMRGTAAMKSLMEHHFVWWMNHRPMENMFSKKAVILAAGAGGGMGKAVNDIKTNLDNWGISAIWTYSFVSGAMYRKDVKEKKLKKLEQDMAALVVKVHNGKAGVRAGQKFHFLCMRYMQRMNWGVPQDKAYWEQRGWLGAARPWKKEVGE